MKHLSNTEITEHLSKIVNEHNRVCVYVSIETDIERLKENYEALYWAKQFWQGIAHLLGGGFVLGAVAYIITKI